MSPVKFEECNTVFHHPKDLSESQCQSLDAFCGTLEGGSMDGETVVVVAWQPSADDLKRLNEGKPVFLSSIGGLVPHALSTTYEEAINIA